MGYFAEIDDNNIVKKVIAISQENVDSGNWGSPETWIQTSYNTRGGKHYPPDSDTSDGDGLRKNYAGKGHIYNASKDAFYAPQPYPSWTLDDDTCQWNPPIARPDDGKFYSWDEDNTQWKEIE